MVTRSTSTADKLAALPVLIDFERDRLKCRPVQEHEFSRVMHEKILATLLDYQALLRGDLVAPEVSERREYYWEKF
jgi:hypothetical protein